MNVQIAVFALLCIFAGAYATVGDVCTEQNNPCADDECCQILSEFIIMSKRAQLPQALLPAQRSGTCQKYKQEGDHCGGMGQMNGYCQCAPGFSCVSHKVYLPSTTAPPSADKASLTSMIAWDPSIGYYYESTCTKD